MNKKSPAYAELHTRSAFSFLEGASLPEELVEEAAKRGLKAIAITDRNSLAGIVRAHVVMKELQDSDAPVNLIIGVELNLADGQTILAYPKTRRAYGRLSALISKGRRRAPKGECLIEKQDVVDIQQDLTLAILPPDDLEQLKSPAWQAHLTEWQQALTTPPYLIAACDYLGDDRQKLTILKSLSARHNMPPLAANSVLMHRKQRRYLADVLTCMREKTTIDALGKHALKNAERHLKSPKQMAKLFRDWPEALANTIRIANECRFSLDELAYEYPDEITQNGRTPQEELEHETAKGLKRRYPEGPPKKVRQQIAHELTMIAELNYAPYFLTVHDIVRFARSRDILCQGRGSAANSAVCYCLGITSVNPAHIDLLFERFISAERNEPPDIDVDFEHERREEVIQYIYEKYGRERAGLTATVIHFKSRSAIREVGKAMGLSEDIITLLASQEWGSGSSGINPAHLAELGLNLNDNRLRQTQSLIRELIGFPRHLSQHVGGFVITRDRLDHMVPIENAAMADRTVIEWDKQDLDALGLLKIDILSLGMLTCIRKSLDLMRRHYGKSYELATLPAEDPAIYRMLSKADSIGVFQVESRAQMSFLPRMKPRNFYDLVIEVAIVRPGPIQGDMVHPYLRRRDGREKVTYESDDLKEVLKRTLGVPLFQEQAMKIAVVAAGFTPSEADQLRRAMATFRRVGTIQTFHEKMVNGMVKRGYSKDFASRCFKQIEGFGEYGFPESHAASFALLVYASAWIKCHHPDVFAAALLNSQPLGFYAPAQIIRDAKEHGVEVRPPDINHSAWDSTLEPTTGKYHALRLGLRQIKGIREEDASWLIAARHNGYHSPEAIWQRAGLSPKIMETLVRADAFASLDLSRREALWQIKALKAIPLPLFEQVGEAETSEEATPPLPKMTLGQEVVADYSALRLSLKAHPLKILRPCFGRHLTSRELETQPNNAPVRLAGLVIIRQRPGTAKGVIFATIEDEHGTANIIIWPKVYDQFRRIVLTARLLEVKGRLQTSQPARKGQPPAKDETKIIHVVANELIDRSYLLDQLANPDFAPGETGKPQPAHAPNHSRLQAPATTPASKPIPRPRHPREQAKALFPSRDFH